MANGSGGRSRNEFKAEAVRLVRESGKSVPTVARELDLTETALRSWVRQAEIDAGRGAPGALNDRGAGGTRAAAAREPDAADELVTSKKSDGLLRGRRTREIPVHRRGEGRLPVRVLCARSRCSAAVLRLAGAPTPAAARAGGRNALGSRSRRSTRRLGNATEPRITRSSGSGWVPDGAQARGAAHAGARAGRPGPPAVSGHDAVAASVSHRPQRPGAALRTTGPDQAWVTDITYIPTGEGGSTWR